MHHVKREMIMIGIGIVGLWSAMPQVMADEAYVLDPMVVTATRTERKTLEVPASVYVISSTDIQKMNVNTVNEVLFRVPGIYSNRLKGVANDSPTVLMRGLNNQTQVLVQVNGQTLNDASSGVVQWSDIPLESVERIEVVKGVASSLYGTNAMGGVINIITKSPQKGKYYGSVGYGSDHTWIKRVGIGDRISDKWGFRVDYEGRKTDGYDNKFVNITPSSKKPSGSVSSVSDISGLMKTSNNKGSTVYRVGSVGRNDFDENNIRAEVYYDISDSKKLSFSYMHHQGEYGYRYRAENNVLRKNGQIFTGGIDLGNGQFLTVPASGFFNAGGGEKQDLYHAVYEDKDHLWKIDAGLLYTKESWSGGLSPVTHSGTYSDSPNKRYSFNIQKTILKTEQDELIAGVQFSRDSVHKKTSNLTDGSLTKASGGHAKSYGAYLQDEHRINDRWGITGALRYDRWKVYSSWMQLDSDPSNVLYYGSRSDSALSPKVSLQYKINENSSTYISWGKAFSAPSLQKMFSGSATVSSYTAANPNLGPQKVTTVEIGYKRNINDRTAFSAAVYHNDISNLLYTRKTGLGTVTYTVNGTVYTNDVQRVENAGSANTNGIEIDVNHRFNDMWSLFVNYAYQNSKIDHSSANPEAEGKLFTYMPRHIFNMGVDYEKGKWSGELSGSYQSKMYGQDDNSDTAENVYTAYDLFFIMNTAVHYQFNSHVGLSISVHNLFDREYYSYNLCEGRTYMARLDYSF